MESPQRTPLHKGTVTQISGAEDHAYAWSLTACSPPGWIGKSMEPTLSDGCVLPLRSVGGGQLPMCFKSTVNNYRAVEVDLGFMSSGTGWMVRGWLTLVLVGDLLV